MKKILSIICVTFLCVLLCGCGKENNLTQSLEEIMDTIYNGIEEDKLPMMLGNTEITDDNLESYTGLKSIDYESGIASESMIGSIAHSVVLLKVKDNVDIEQTKKDIKENVNPRKWICVGVDDEKNIIVDNIGNTIVLIMSNEISTELHNNFLSLKK